MTLTTACGGPDSAKLIASAQANIAKGDTRTAIVELKSALQKGNQSDAARFLLGKALLVGGNPIGAEVELRKALDLRYAEDQVVPELARAMLSLGQNEKLLKEFGPTRLSDRQATADLNVTLAKAYVSLGRNDQARAAADAALSAVPDYGPAVLFMIRVRADTGDVDGSLAALDAELAKRPQDVEAWQLKANLLYFAKRNADAALVAYRRAVALRPTSVEAHSGAMTVLLDRVDIEGARTQLAEMSKSLPGNPQTQFFEGYLALLERKLERAQEIAEQLLRIAPDNPRVLQLAGLVQFERHNLVQAESLLNKALQAAPELLSTRRGLAQTYLARSEPARALETIQPLLDRPDPAAADWTMRGQALLQEGELASAEAAFVEATKLDPGNSGRQTDLAISKVLRGDTEAGLAMLSSLASNKDSSAADLPLIATLMRQRDYPAALKAIDRFEQKQPDRPVAANLRATVLLALGDRPGATRAFEQALKIQPSFLPAATGLAELALADNKPNEARKLLDDVVKADPKNPRALLASAKLRARIGASREDIVAMLTDAVQRAPQDSALRLALIDYQLDTKEPTAALESARQAVATLPEDPKLIEALGRAQAASGDANQADTTFNKLAQMLPNSPQPLLRLAQVQRSSGKRDAEIETLKRALVVAPDNLLAQEALASAYLARGKTADALEVARTIQKQRPKQDQGYRFEATIEASRGRFEQALQAYRAGMKATGGTSELAMGVHTALTALKQPAQADSQAADWLKAHPKDTVFRFYLGDLAFAQRDFTAAQKRYREVLALQPDQPQALNNVAGLMAMAKQPGAVALAQKANQLRPDSATFLDTLASALAAEGQLAKAVDAAKQALAIDGSNPTLRLHLARFLIQAGDNSAAKRELQTLAALGDKFAQQPEVDSLLKAL